ncbi:MAG: AAA family ATPase [Candidatus Sedimenticola sp. 1PA]
MATRNHNHLTYATLIPMQTSAFLSFAHSIVERLIETHEKHPLHGEIRPDNITWDPQNLKADLSSTKKKLPEPASLSPEHLPYISPEQSGRINREIDHRSDLYALGIIFYEMLTGKLPFSADDPLEIIHLHIAKQPQPPYEFNPTVFHQLSDITMCLLEKSPGERYQSATSLLGDLKHCAEDFSKNGSIGEFELADSGYLSKLHFSHKLYGRNNEKRQLTDILEKVAAGAVEGCWVSGYSGVGKSALVRELIKPILSHHGLFLEGKYDQLHRNSPYTGWIQALSALVRKIQQGTPQALNEWKQRLQEAVGNNGQVLVNIIPDLEMLIGPQPEVIELHGQEAQARMSMLVQRFIRSAASEQHPLVIFLDDLQWVDLASLDLLKLLLSDQALSHTFFLGAYRDNEVGPHHSLRIAQQALEQQQAPIQSLHVENIEMTSVHQLITEVLHASMQTTETLAEVVYQKTAGNPFFIQQTLIELHRHKILAFDEQNRRWLWDDKALLSLELSDNVADMVVGGLRNLSKPCQEVLKYLACIGHRISGQLLELVISKKPDQAELLLYEITTAKVLLSGEGEYRFAHDRIQEACYSLIEEPQRSAYHLQVYRYIERLYQQSPDDELFLEMNRHRRMAKDLLESEADRLVLAKMNLEAGEINLKNAAFSEAHDGFIEAIDLLPKNSWDKHYEVTLKLYVYAHETAFQQQDYEQMQQLFEMLEQHVDNPKDKLGYFKTRVVYLSLQAKHQEATELGCEKLRDVGIDVPQESELLSGALAIIDRHLEMFVGQDSQSVLQGFLSPAAAADTQLIEFIQTLAQPTYYYKAEYYYYLQSLASEMSIQHGSFSGLADSLVGVGVCLSSLHRYKDAEAFGKVAVEYAMHTEMNRCKALNEYALEIFPWRGPLAKARDLGMQGFEYGQIEMDPEYPSYCLFSYLDSSLLLGTPLKEFHDREQWAIDYATSADNTLSQGCFVSPERLTRILLGEPGVAFDQEYEASFQASFGDISMARAYYHLFKMIDHFMFGRYAEAQQEAEAIGEDIDQICHFVVASYFHLFYALAITRSHKELADVSADEQEILAQHKKTYRLWCDNYAPNFQNKADLIDAELARLAGKHHKAMDLYHSAIAGAHKQRFVQEEALACEMAGNYFLNDGKKEVAALYLTQARQAYSTWGAVAKVEELQARYPKLLSPRDRDQDHKAGDETSSLDLRTVIKAYHAITGEIVLQNLLQKLLQIAMENAGAQQGFLLQLKNGRWVIEAESDINEDNIKVLQSIDIASHDILSTTLVNHVARTLELVVLGNAASEGHFTDDSFIQNHQSKSILCLPLLNQGKVSGILYLANDLINDVFSQNRVELLKLLSSQMAMALDNAMLYSSLEQRVKERTHELVLAKEQAEAASIALGISEQRLKESQQIAKLGQWELDLVTKELTWSDEVFRLFEIDQEQFAASYETFLELIHPDDREAVDSAYTESLANKQPYEIVHRLLMPDGRIKYVREQCRTEYDGDTPLVSIGTILDITTLKEKEKEAQQAREIAETANKAKSLFLANMIHELRTPLNAVLGFSELMSADSGLNDQHKSNLEIINRSGHHLLQLINDVLDMSKIEAGKTRLEPTNLDLGALILDVTDMLRVRAEQKGLRLLLDQTSDFPRFVRADGPKIRQILINLLSNAIKFTDQGGVTLRLDASNGNPGHITLRVEVQDTGHGISKDDIGRIFQPFEQLATSSEQKGTGLGLAITRQFIKLMGGEISAASKQGKGSTFYFHIRVEPGEAEQVQVIEEKAVRRVIGLIDSNKEWRILIAEDQLENQLLLKQLLEQAGFQVCIAEDGEETIQLFKSWHPHFIWMDRRMPHMDGLTATRKIRQLPGGKEVKIAALTASVFKEQKDEVMEAGSDDFVRKPYRPSEVFDCMARHLDLDYRYEEETEKSSIGITNESPAISAEQIATLPQDIREALERAATVLDVEEMHQVVKRIEATDAELAAALRQRVEAFDFTAIKKLLSCATDE